MKNGEASTMQWHDATPQWKMHQRTAASEAAAMGRHPRSAQMRVMAHAVVVTLRCQFDDSGQGPCDISHLVEQIDDLYRMESEATSEISLTYDEIGAAVDCGTEQKRVYKCGVCHQQS